MAEIQFGTGVHEVNINLQGSRIAEQEAKNILQEQADKGSITETFLMGGKLAAKIGNSIDEAQTIDINADYARFSSSNEFANADGHRKIEMLAAYQDNDKMQDSSYADKWDIKASTATYNAHRQARKETNNIRLQHAGEQAEIWMDKEIVLEDGTVTSNRTLGKNYSDFVDIKYDEYGGQLDKKNIGIMVAAHMEDLGNEVIASTDTSPSNPNASEELQENIKIGDELTEGLDNNMFYKSKNAQAVARKKKSDAQRAAVIAQKKQEILISARTVIANNRAAYDSDVPEGLGKSPAELDKYYATAFENPIALQNALAADTKLEQEQVERVDFLTNNLPGQPRAEGYELVPEHTKKKWKDNVTGYAMSAAANGDHAEFINILKNESEYSGDIGTTYNQLFAQATKNEEIVPMLQFLNTASYQPGGATAIAQSVGTDKYFDMFMTSSIATNLFNGDLIKAKDYIAQADISPGEAKIPMDIMGNMNDHAKKLGTQHQAYMNTMNIMFKINPKIASDNYDDVAQHYFEMFKKTEGISVDISIAPLNLDNAIRKDDIIDIIKQDYERKTGNEASSFVPISNEHVAVADDLTGSISIINYKSIYEVDNRNWEFEQTIEQQKLREERGTPIGDIKRTAKALPDIGVGAFADITEGIAGVFNRMGSAVKRAFIEDAGLKTSEDIEKAFKNTKKIEKELIDFTNLYKSTLPTKEPTINNDTRSFSQKMTMRQAYLKNKQEQEDLERVVDYLINTQFK